MKLAQAKPAQKFNQVHFCKSWKIDIKCIITYYLLLLDISLKDVFETYGSLHGD